MTVGNDGKFTPRGRVVYELVLEIQQVRPCALPIPLRSPAPVARPGGAQALRALGHHAVPPENALLAMSVGAAVFLLTALRQTVQRAIYFSPHLVESVRDSRYINHAVLARYERVGEVHIDDVVLITEDSYGNLGSAVEWAD